MAGESVGAKSPQRSREGLTFSRSSTMMDDSSTTNHEEALQLAFLKQKESNLARCYIDLRLQKPYGMVVKADKELSLSVSENGRLIAGAGVVIVTHISGTVVEATEIRKDPRS